MSPLDMAKVLKTKMTVPYDKYYQTKNFFGEPNPELITFFTDYPKKGKVLDLGCGQGRNAIALARLGYSVTGIDSSKVGIDQMNQIARNENLKLVGHVIDINTIEGINKFDIILLDSMFHFSKKDKEKEIELIKKIISDMKGGCLLVVCIQNTGNKVQILNEVIDFEKKLNRIKVTEFKYIFEDKASGHKSSTDYTMIIVLK